MCHMCHRCALYLCYMGSDMGSDMYHMNRIRYEALNDVDSMLADIIWNPTWEQTPSAVAMYNMLCDLTVCLGGDLYC